MCDHALSLDVRLKAISTGGSLTEAQESKLFTQLCSEIFNIDFAVCIEP